MIRGQWGKETIKSGTGHLRGLTPPGGQNAFALVKQLWKSSSYGGQKIISQPRRKAGNVYQRVERQREKEKTASQNLLRGKGGTNKNNYSVEKNSVYGKFNSERPKTRHGVGMCFCGRV